MHPALHHTSTTKPLDEERCLGFLPMGPHTEPQKGNKKGFLFEETPTKTGVAKKIKASSPEFAFSYKRQSLDLSPAARKMMADSREEAAKIKARMVVDKDAAVTAPSSTIRRIATPRGKCGRFSDVHMSQFKKMDSIANHPSAFRADPTRFTPRQTSLKRTQSNAGLDESEGPASPIAAPSAGRPGAANSEIQQSKRIKCTEKDDASTSRLQPPASKRNVSVPSTPTTSRFDRFKSALPSMKHLPHTPISKMGNALPRSQSVKTWRSMLSPPLARSASTRSLIPPPPAKGDQGEHLSRKSRIAAKLPMVKSILRTPQRLYSNDPSKLAAGTHIQMPEGELFLNKDLPAAPATAPVKKHVNFTSSTASEPKVIKPEFND